MVSATINLPLLIKVDQINQQLITDRAYEAGWVPANAVACSGGKYSDVASTDLAPTLAEEQQTGRGLGLTLVRRGTPRFRR